MNKSLPIAVTALAALALAGSSVVGTASADDGGKGGAPRVPSARAQVSACTGGPTVAMISRAMDFQSIPAGTAAEIEGSQWNVKGPKKGTDTVLVTLSSMASSGGAGELTSVTLYRDGVGTKEGTKYYTYNNILDQATVQFCTKLRKGQHILSLRASDGGGGASTLYYPTITYQRFG